MGVNCLFFSFNLFLRYVDAVRMESQLVFEPYSNLNMVELRTRLDEAYCRRTDISMFCLVQCDEQLLNLLMHS